MGFDRETYYLLKEAGLCVRCKAAPVPGKVHCQKCLTEINSYEEGSPERVEKRRKRHRDRKRLLYCKRKKAGICVLCGKRAANRTLKCEPCERRYNDRYRPQAKTSTKVYTCGLCGGTKHDVRTCPKRATHDIPSIEHYATARAFSD